jgi:hypothetical protein
MEHTILADNADLNVLFGHLTLEAFLQCQNRRVDCILEFNIILVAIASPTTSHRVVPRTELLGRARYHNATIGSGRSDTIPTLQEGFG